MRIFVVTDAKGRVIASGPLMSDQYPADAPVPGRPTALRGQRVHELDVPPELQHIDSAAELHQRLQKLVRSRRSTTTAKGATSKKKRRKG
jgi:hypothetical protein